MKLVGIISNILFFICLSVLALFVQLEQSCLSAYAISVNELEPNDTNETTNLLSPGTSGHGTIMTGPEFDGWFIPSIHSGDVLFALLTSPNNSGDPILTGYYFKSIAETANADMYNDDGGPPAAGFRDSLFAGEPLRRTGSLYLRVDGFGSSLLNPYELFQVVVGPNEIMPEVEPNNTPQTAMPINAPAILAYGTSEADYYSFYANAGERIVVMIDQNPGRPDPATPFVPKITLFSTDGTTDISSAGNTYVCPDDSPCGALGAIPAPTSGIFYVRVTKAPNAPSQTTPNQDGDYRIAVLVEGTTPLVGACCNGTSCGLKSAANCHGLFAGGGTTCLGDTDGDGVPNDCDNCKQIGNQSQEDTDGDDAGDACEDCSTDPHKLSPGACGCGTVDVDSDHDGVADCNDSCPADGAKSAPGACGCGVADTDANSNSVPDCLTGPEVRALLSSAADSLKKLKSLPSSANAKAKKARAAKITAIKSLVSQIQNLVQVSGAKITVQAGFNLPAEVSKFAKLASGALRASSGTLGKATKQAAAQASKILGAIAA